MSHITNLYTMKILLLAPHPFYIDRGSPIDVLLVLKVLSERKNIFVDVIVYGEGKDIDLPNVNVYRTPNYKILRKLRPGFTLKKIICSIFLFFKAWKMIKRVNYNLIHAGEDAVFIAMFFKFIYKIPYVYDLDSSMPQQIVERYPLLKMFFPLFNWMEANAIQGSVVNLPVCNALAKLCVEKLSKKTVTLHDISQLNNPGAASKCILLKEYGIDKQILLYIGNLEAYQGINLLLESFKIASVKTNEIDLVIIGGISKDINFYREKTLRMGIEKRVHFIGPKPFDKLEDYLAEADIIASPRIRGLNTPMKIFAYLHSGKAVIATDLYTHNQIITKKEAYLVPANPKDFAEGIIILLENENLRRQLGKNGQAFVEKNHTYSAHQKRLHEVYDWIEEKINSNNISEINHNISQLINENFSDRWNRIYRKRFS